MKNNYINIIKISHRLLLVLSLSISLISLFTYDSFFIKHFHLKPIYIYSLFAISSFIEKIYSLDNKKNKFTSKAYIIGVIFFAISYLLLNIAEAFTYSNFVFSKLHIHYELLIYPLSILLIEYIFGLNIKDTNKRIKIGFYKLLNLNTIAIPLVILIFMNNIIGLTSRMKKDVYFMITNIRATRDDIYEFKLGKLFYDYTNFINMNTSKDSKILVPPFPAYPWPQTGNVVYMRYFLSPRTLYSGNEYSPSVNLKDYDYVLIAWGETPTVSGGYTHGWPKFNVEAEYILYMEKDGQVRKESSNYLYSKQLGEQWGLIKIKK